MLIRFKVKNFLSFRDEVELSMVPGLTRSHTKHIVQEKERGEFSLLRTGIIYGANASGKSNLVKAMHFAQQFIIHGSSPKRRIPNNPFKLDINALNEPTKFEFEIKTKTENYAYGFEITANQVVSEWLYIVSRTKEAKQLFERRVDQEGISTFDSPYRSNKKQKDEQFLSFVERGTRPNQLFITETLEQNVPDFEPVFNWFKKTLTIVFPYTKPRGLEVYIDTDEEFKQKTVELLNNFDIDIVDLALKKVSLEIAIDLPEEIRQDIIQDLTPESKFLISSSIGESFILQLANNGQVEALKLMTVHKTSSNEMVYFELQEESDGTRRLIQLVPIFFDLILNDRVFVIDELDRSLHAGLSCSFVELFLQQGTRASQLIATTHETNMLTFDLLRKDEIWFIDKDKNGHSHLYSLEEFAPRYDKDIRKGYLFGRFGGIPNLANLRSQRHKVKSQQMSSPIEENAV